MEKWNLSFGLRTNRLLFLWIIVFLVIILCVDLNSSNHLSAVRGSRNNIRQNLGRISNQRQTAISRSLNRQRQTLRSNSQTRGRNSRTGPSQNCIPGSLCRTATSSRRRIVQNPRRLAEVRRIIASRRRSSQPSSSRGDSGLSFQARLGNISGRLSLGGRGSSRVQPANSVRQRSRNRRLQQNTNTNSRRQNGGSATQNNNVAAIPRQEVDSRLSALETISNVLPKTIGNLINSFRSNNGGTPAIGLGIGIGSSRNNVRQQDRTIPQQPQQDVPSSDQSSLQQSMDMIRQTFIRSRSENPSNRKQTPHPLQSPNSIIQIPEAKPLPAPPVVSNQPQTNAISQNAITFQAPALDQGQFLLDQNGQFSQQGGMQQLSINSNNMNRNIQNGMSTNMDTNPVVRNLNNQGLMDNNNNVFQTQTQNLNSNQQMTGNGLGPGSNNQLQIGLNSGNSIFGPSAAVQNINLDTNLQNNLIPGTNSQNQIIGLQNNFNQNFGPVGPGPNLVPSIGIQNNNFLNSGQVMGSNNLFGSSAGQVLQSNTQSDTSGQDLLNTNGQMMSGQTVGVPSIQNTNVQFLQNQNSQGQTQFLHNQNSQGQVQFSQNQNFQGQISSDPGIQFAANNQVFPGQSPTSNTQGTQNLIQTPMINIQNQNNIGVQGQNPPTGFQGVQNNRVMQNQLTFTNTPVGPRPMAHSPSFNAQIPTSNIQNMQSPNANLQVFNNQVQNMNQNSFNQGIFNNGNQNDNNIFGNPQIQSHVQSQLGQNQIMFPAQPAVVVGQGPATAGFQQIQNQVPFTNRFGGGSQTSGAVLGTLQTIGQIPNIPTLMPKAQFAPATTNAPPTTTPKRVVIAVDPKSKGIKIVPDGNGGVKVIHLRHAITATPWNETIVIPTTTAMPIVPDTLLRPDVKNISDPELLRKLERTDRVNTTDIPEELEINGTSYDGTYHNPIMPGRKDSSPINSQDVLRVQVPSQKSKQTINAKRISDPELLRKLERTDRINTTDIPEELEINGKSYDGTYHNPIIPGSSGEKVPPSANSQEVAQAQSQEPSSSHQTATASSVEAEETTLMSVLGEELEELEEMTERETTTTEATTTQTSSTTAPPTTTISITAPPVTDIAINNLASADVNTQKQGSSFTLVKATLSSNSHHKSPEQGNINLKEHLFKIMRNSGGSSKPGIELKIISLPKRDAQYIMDSRPR